MFSNKNPVNPKSCTFLNSCRRSPRWISSREAELLNPAPLVRNPGYLDEAKGGFRVTGN